MNQSFYVGALGATSSSEKMSVVANNIANVNNTGFKPKTAVFSDLLNYNLNDTEGAVTELQAGNGVKVQKTYTSFGASALHQTGETTDYAIMDDNAFFMVQDPTTGALSYTRDGHFHRGERPDGFYLMTDGGKLVLDRNRQPCRAEVADVERMQNEMEEGYQPEEENALEEDKPQVGVFTFSNPSRMLSVGNNEYVPMDQGMEPILVRNPGMATGALEQSGTDLSRELVRMIECQRAYTYALKMVTTSDEIETTINTLRG